MRQSVLTRATYSLVSSTPEVKCSTFDDDALHEGIHFKAKFIGSMEVPRPSNRVEIVAAMRTVRFEFKEKGVKKTKIDLSISTSGVTAVRRTKPKLWKKWTSVDSDDGKLLLQHPVYRIFYVSHDSQDLQIFSYIACDAASVFKCHVFKASTKSGAIHVVRTIGRVFDICHRINQQSTDSDKAAEAGNVKEPGAAEEFPTSGATTERADIVNAVGKDEAQQPPLETEHSSKQLSETSAPAISSTADKHVEMALRQQLQLESLKSQNLVAEIRLLQTQLKAETAARISLQLRVQQMIQQNQRLLNYVSELASGLKPLGTNDVTDQLVDLNTNSKRTSSLQLPVDFLSTLSSSCLQNELSITNLNCQSTISPDSGHREMSSEGGASVCTNTPSDTSYYSAAFAASAIGFDESQFDAGSSGLQHDFRSNLLPPIPLALSSDTLQPLHLETSEAAFATFSGVPAGNPASAKSPADEAGMKRSVLDVGNSSNLELDSFSKLFSDSWLLDFDTLCTSNNSSQQNATFGVQPRNSNSVVQQEGR